MGVERALPPSSRFRGWPIGRNGPFLGPQQLGRAPEAFLARRLCAHTHSHTEQFSSSPIPSDMELFLNSEHISGFSLKGGGGSNTKTQPINHKESIETIVRGKNRMWLQPRLLGRRCMGEMKNKRNNYHVPHWPQISLAK